jgi:predicted DNA-binding transcriptional regulator AlpA
MARLFCENCQRESNFLPIHMVQKIAGVSRSTIYYWLEHRWVHWRELPSGRRIICETCLSQPARHAAQPTSQPTKPHFLS